MVCKNVEEYTIEYGKLAEEIKNICANRACTSGAIQKTLGDQGTKVGEATILAMISQIKGMVTLCRGDTCGIGDTIIYLKGKIFKSEMIGNLMLKISYRKFYLYNPERYKDTAFRDQIQSKLEFEVYDRWIIRCSSELKWALGNINIPKEKWENYVFIGEGTDKVYCIDTGGYDNKKYLGRLVMRTKV